MASKEKEIFEKYFCEKYCDRHCSKGKMCSFKDYILSVNKKYLIDENTIGYGIKQMLNDLDRLELYDKAKEVAKRIFNNPDLCYRDEEEFLEYIEEEARKELENDN